MCDYVLWPLVGRASPHDLFRRAGTLALPRETPHLPTRTTRVGRARRKDARRWIASQVSSTIRDKAQYR